MSNLTDTIDQIIHENNLPFDWPEEVLNENLLSTLYGTDIVVENNKTVGRLVIHS